MKFLLDNNLSFRLVRRLADLVPDCVHTTALGLERATDLAIWERAAGEGRMIVTRDDDFLRKSLLEGPPPKIIWIRLDNPTIDDVERLLRASIERITTFESDAGAGILVIP